MADNALKDQGNEEFKAGNYLKAAALYSKAIKEDPENAALYSNRSAALLKLNKVTKALEDADACIKFKPQWEKGYFRKGAVLEELQKYSEALEVFQQAHRICPENKEIAVKIKSLSRLVKASHSKQQPVQSTDKPLQAPSDLAAFIRTVAGESAEADFLKACLELACDHMVTLPAEELAPLAHFLPGSNSKTHADEEEHVRGASAFDSPDMYQKFVVEMRQYAEVMDAQAVCVVVPKQCIGYPTVWVKPGWPASASGPGSFVHFESKQVKKTLYIPFSTADKVPGIPVVLPDACDPILPSLLR